jgi:hypothetical protein
MTIEIGQVEAIFDCGSVTAAHDRDRLSSSSRLRRIVEDHRFPQRRPQGIVSLIRLTNAEAVKGFIEL